MHWEAYPFLFCELADVSSFIMAHACLFTQQVMIGDDLPIFVVDDLWSTVFHNGRGVDAAPVGA